MKITHSRPGIAMTVFAAIATIWLVHTGIVGHEADKAMDAAISAPAPVEPSKPVARVDPGQQAWQADADSKLGKWSAWHTENYKSDEGIPSVALWVRDTNYTHEFLSNAYAIGYRQGTDAMQDYMTGFDGAAAIPQFNIIFSGGILRAILNDPASAYQSTLYATINVRFNFKLKDGRTVMRSIPAELSQSGSAVMDKDATLAVMDFIMVSDEMDISVPGYNGSYTYHFDCKTFSANGIVNLKG